MIEDQRYARLEILMQQNRYVEADKILKDLLSEDASDVQVMAMLAEVNLQLNNGEFAKTVIDRAIGLSPDSAHLFYIKARVFIHLEDYVEAEDNIRFAIQLDADDADYFAVYANIKLGRKDYEESLNLANKALEIDSTNLLALNSRSTALLKLNRKDESFHTIEGALREDPNNAYTHANYGWSLLEKGDHKKALEHFKESLKNNPDFEYAQSGLLEAIKATNPAYRLFLKYSFWMGNLTAKYQWGVIIGFYVGSRALRALAKSSETLQPYLTPLIVALAVLAFSTWIMNPIGNLFLRFNKYGQLLLDKREKKSSNFVAINLVLFIIGILCFFLSADERFLSLAVFGFAMMLPCGIMFSPSKFKDSLIIYAAVMGGVGVIAVVLTFLTGQLLNPMSMLFVIAFVAFQWVANYLRIKENNR